MQTAGPDAPPGAKQPARQGERETNAERIFARLLDNNFTEGRSVHLAMTYSPAGYRRLEARAAAIMQQLPGIPERTPYSGPLKRSLKTLCGVYNMS